jgi:hypothetical protein
LGGGQERELSDQERHDGRDGVRVDFRIGGVEGRQGCLAGWEPAEGREVLLEQLVVGRSENSGEFPKGFLKNRLMRFEVSEDQERIAKALLPFVYFQLSRRAVLDDDGLQNLTDGEDENVRGSEMAFEPIANRRSCAGEDDSA